MIHWCCESFEQNYGEKVSRGCSVKAIRRSNGSLRFYLYFRSIDVEYEKEVPLTDFPISIESEIPVRFCPWCGSDLLSSYSDDGIEIQLFEDPYR